MLRVAWFVYITAIAIRGGFYGYAHNGVPGLALGLAIGTGVGVLSAFICSFLFSIIFKTGTIIFRRCKPSVRKNPRPQPQRLSRRCTPNRRLRLGLVPWSFAFSKSQGSAVGIGRRTNTACAR